MVADVLSGVDYAFDQSVYPFPFFYFEPLLILVTQIKESNWRYCSRCFSFGNANGYDKDHSVISGCYNRQNHIYATSENYTLPVYPRISFLLYYLIYNAYLNYRLPSRVV